MSAWWIVLAVVAGVVVGGVAALYFLNKWAGEAIVSRLW